MIGAHAVYGGVVKVSWVYRRWIFQQRFNDGDNHVFPTSFIVIKRLIQIDIYSVTSCRKFDSSIEQLFLISKVLPYGVVKVGAQNIIIGIILINFIKLRGS